LASYGSDGMAILTKRDRTAELPAGHVQHLGRVVENLIGRHERERPAHELDDGAQAVHGCADAEAGEPGFGDGRVDDTARAELLEHTARDLVRAAVFSDFFTHEEDAHVAAHLLAHRLAQCVSEFDFSHGCWLSWLRASGCWLLAGGIQTIDECGKHSHNLLHFVQHLIVLLRVQILQVATEQQ